MAAYHIDELGSEYDASLDFTDDIGTWSIEDKSRAPRENIELWEQRWIEHVRTNPQRKKGNSNTVSPKTIRSYRHGIAQLKLWAERFSRIPLSMINAKYLNRFMLDYQLRLAKEAVDSGRLDIQTYRRLLVEAKEGILGHNDSGFTILEQFENTLRQRQTIIKMFFRFITEKNSEQVDFTKALSEMRNIRVGERFTQYLTPKELDDMIRYMQIWPDIYKDHYPKSHERYAYRNALLLTLYALTGARGDEVVHIRLRDIREHKEGRKGYYFINIEKGKGGTKRTVRVEQKHISRFLAYFKSVLPDDSYYLSSTYRDGQYRKTPSDINNVRKFANRILKLLGINKSGLHIFRRGYVTKRIAIDKEVAATVAKEVGNTTAILEKHYLKNTAEVMI